jgi:hypothetical protein
VPPDRPNPNITFGPVFGGHVSISNQIADFYKNLGENATASIIQQASLAQITNFQNLIKESSAVGEIKSAMMGLANSQELFELAATTKNSLVKIAEESSALRSLASVQNSAIRASTSIINSNLVDSMDIDNDRKRMDSVIMPTGILNAPPRNDFERNKEIRRSNQLQEEILQELRKLRIALEEDTATALRPSKNTASPTFRTQTRGDVFKRLKDKHPEWSQARVAMEAIEELGEDVTENTVRNTYRLLGWKWERGDRIR